MSTPGIHHVTAICDDARRNVSFYAGVLGLRLVKRTVNFDDPQTYHLYYGDETGQPGSLITFFAWPGAARGRVGPGQIAVTAFAVAPRALGAWVERLLRNGVAFRGPSPRHVGGVDEQVLSFEDGDGLMLEIVATPRANELPGRDDAFAIRGIHGVTLWEEHAAPTAGALTELLGLHAAGGEDTTDYFVVGPSVVGVRNTGNFPKGNVSVGTVHHVAWRMPSDDAEVAMRQHIVDAGLTPTPVIDRQYFHSVYFAEPGGVLFELATDGPGFTVDEPAERLGQSLMLPPQYEPFREQITRGLPEIYSEEMQS